MDYRAKYDELDRYLFSIEYPDVDAPIRGRSILDLYRAFSIGGIVAFVGSGTSVLLNYNSWKEFAVEFADKALQGTDQADEDQDKDSDELDYCKSLVTGLRDLKKRSNEHDWDAAAVLSLAREVAQQRDLIRWYPPQPTKHGKSRKQEQKTNKLVLEESLRDMFRIRHPGTFNPSELTERQLGADKWRASRVSRKARKTKVAARADQLPGLKYFGIREKQEPDRNGRGTHGKNPPSHKQLLTAKRPFIDSLACLRNEWQVSRFVTVNYDLEIERVLEAYDFPFYSLTVQLEPGKSERDQAPATGTTSSARLGARQGAVAADFSASTRDGQMHFDSRSAEREDIVRSRLGERGRSIDLSPENAAELMLFAANYPSNLIQVIHLHGSVRDPSRMVVTDSDYNQRYYWPGGWPAVMGDGQELLFRGNAVVFVGVGMKEGELLRPLRLLAQAPGRESRPVFAFLESQGDADDTSVALKLYQRYGVRTIFVGTQLRRSLDPQFGSFSEHPLVLDLKRKDELLFAGKSESEQDVIIARLSTLNDELAVLDAMKAFARQRTEDTKPFALVRDEFFRSVVKKHSELEHLRNTPEVAHGTAWSKKKAEELLDEIYAIENVPRLRLSEWHSVVFQDIYRVLFTGNAISKQRFESISGALDSLRSAIRARALRDGLTFFAYKARQWRWRWAHYPREKVERPPTDNGLSGRFRRAKVSAEDRVKTWHMCETGTLPTDGSQFRNNGKRKNRVHDSDSQHVASVDVLYGGCRLTEPDLTKSWLKLGPSSSRLAIARWSSGHGKGYAAGRLADKGRQESSRPCWIISFANSCEFDSCFDLMAQMVGFAESKKGEAVDCVLAQVDLIFNRSQGMPKLIEWHWAFRKLLACEQVNLLVFCEYPQTSNYFIRLRSEVALEASKKAGKKADDRNGEPNLIDEPAILVAQNGGLEEGHVIPGVAEYRHIVERCCSRWLALFLSVVLSRDTVKNPGSAKEADFSLFRAALMDDVEHVLRLVQDPRQRTPSVVDTVMAHLERRVIFYGDKDERRTKILAHAILKHLFAFGTSVDQRVLIFCPEIEDILKKYDVGKYRGDAAIAQAVDWLIERHLIVKLRPRPDLADALQVRLGLHSQMRRYLASKKALPFALVQGRERTAVTLLPVIDEEAVPLDSDDLNFLGETFDQLIEASQRTPDSDKGLQEEGGDVANDGSGKSVDCRHASLQSECVRAAFGLMRGSLRIGIVLRASPQAEAASDRSPLDAYFHRLLALRRAVLRIGDYAGTDADTIMWPLYEREWVWLINEMGVVRMLQGSVHDAKPLFELAVHFEERRLARLDGGYYENWIYPGGQGDFSVTKMRILLNLTLTLIEHGEFSRVERIVQRARIDLGRLEADRSLPAVGDGDSSQGESVREKHREVRVMNLLCILIESRVAYLAGSIGSANTWLDEQRKEVVDLGLHGLTAFFFQILMDVHLNKGMQDKAAKSLKVARTESEASGRPDLILSAILSECEYSRDVKVGDSALNLRHNLARLRKVELEAKRLGMVRAEVTTYLVRAKLYLGFGELRSAREDIMNALTLATTHGLRVKRIVGLIGMAALLGASSDENERDQRKEAIELVETAKLEAERMGYKVAAVSAKELEIVLRGQGAIEDWASGRFMREAAAPNSGSAAG